MLCWYDDSGSMMAYRPIEPRPDGDEISTKRRLMLVHTPNGPIIKVAPPGVLSSGWVIGTEV